MRGDRIVVRVEGAGEVVMKKYESGNLSFTKRICEPGFRAPELKEIALDLKHLISTSPDPN